MDIADALEANEKLIKAENEADIAAAQEAGYDNSLLSRLTLKPEKVRNYGSMEYYHDQELACSYLVCFFFYSLVFVH